MWCIQKIDKQYRECMYKILRLYERPYNPLNPVVGLDEKPKQLLDDVRQPIYMKQGSPEKVDSEYVRKGKANIFVAVDFKGGKRCIKVTQRRTKQDFAKYVKHLANVTFKNAKKIDIILDNLNTHFESSLFETFTKEEAGQILDKVRFHHTPAHASWLNVAEIEINVMDIESIGRRIPSKESLRNIINEWVFKRNQEKKKIDWRFTRKIADQKLSKYYT